MQVIISLYSFLILMNVNITTIRNASTSTIFFLNFLQNKKVIVWIVAKYDTISQRIMCVISPYD